MEYKKGILIIDLCSGIIIHTVYHKMSIHMKFIAHTVLKSYYLRYAYDLNKLVLKININKSKK